MKRTFNRFAAKLLFQFRVGKRGWARRLICEERILLVKADSSRRALSSANRAGRAAQFKYRNDQGRVVHFEFVGVLDLLHLGLECEEDEAWYTIKEMVEPMKRRKKLLPSDGELLFRGRVIGAKRGSSAR
jgi:hypothetical protein